MTSLPTAITAKLDQLHANGMVVLDCLARVVREMAATGIDPAERMALIVYTLDESGLPREELAGLVASAVLRLADRDAWAEP